MRRTALIGIVAVLLGSADWAYEQNMSRRSIRFDAIDVYVDSGAQPLAAYQLDLSATAGDVKIVGIEGGEHPAFTDPPYYDPAAMRHDRVIIAAFSTAPPERLPNGRTRIATIHVQIAGDIEPTYITEFTIAATADGKVIAADVVLQTGVHQ